MWVACYLQHIGWRAGFADGGSYGDFYHSNPTVNCADRAVVRLQQVGAVILYCLERPGSDATRADKAIGRLIGAASPTSRSALAPPVVPVMDAVRVELEAIAFRDGLKRP